MCRQHTVSGLSTGQRTSEVGEEEKKEKEETKNLILQIGNQIKKHKLPAVVVLGVSVISAYN